MQNQQIRLKRRQKPIIPRSTVVGFRVSHDQLEKLKATQRTLKIRCWRIFEWNSWRIKFSNLCIYIALAIFMNPISLRNQQAQCWNTGIQRNLVSNLIHDPRLVLSNWCWNHPAIAMISWRKMDKILNPMLC